MSSLNKFKTKLFILGFGEILTIEMHHWTEDVFPGPFRSSKADLYQKTVQEMQNEYLQPL